MSSSLAIFLTYLDDGEAALLVVAEVDAGLVDAALVVALAEHAGLELLALHARLQLGAFSGTRLDERGGNGIRNSGNKAISRVLT